MAGATYATAALSKIGIRRLRGEACVSIIFGHPRDWWAGPVSRLHTNQSQHETTSVFITTEYTARERDVLSFSILGALEVHTGTGQVEIPGDLQRTLVQVLLVSEGQAVSGETLIDEMWGESAPANRVNALQAHISRLRRRLRSMEPERSASRLTMHPSGYRLAVDEDELDAAQFLRKVRRAEVVVSARPAEAADLLRSALSMWRGPVFGSLPGGSVCRLTSALYEEHRLRARELLFDAELSAGHHANILAELYDAHVSNLLRERFCEQLMIALYRSGRQADALDTYRRMWQRLSEEIGVLPSPSLRSVEHAILSHDPSLTLTSGEALFRPA
ncbi:AfsR/SARP family transcriptional regulator [Streptomyces caelestis]|jgi:DNA-binding SARP family transcriptional activator|uniref:AfsR/SARP family transcriptional regulator n=1 Tax=Streptomyces caelestis TaxID=36816 RepID=UPI0036FF2E29